MQIQINDLQAKKKALLTVRGQNDTLQTIEQIIGLALTACGYRPALRRAIALEQTFQSILTNANELVSKLRNLLILVC